MAPMSSLLSIVFLLAMMVERSGQEEHGRNDLSRAAGSRQPPESPARAEGDILCEMAWGPSFASVFHIRQGVDHLRKIPGNCTNGPGPANCGRVSCSYRSGIWFCNDTPHPVSVPCSMLGDRAGPLTRCTSPV
ncbi:hypothetical protein F4802DRAFT_547065 [Xylaria palmicola]|nr:hypothetical protein F4802DRAFT_547065 [Xylaria palmicola]